MSRCSPRPRATHNILSRPWKKLVAEDFGFHISQQMLGTVASKELIPMRDLIADAAARKIWRPTPCNGSKPRS